MNKKTILMAPLAVLAMGLTACNKGWPSKTIEEATEIGKKIKIELDKIKAENFDQVIMKGNTKETKKTSKAYSETSSSIEVYSDASNGYNKEIEKNNSKSNEQTSSYESLSYYVYKNNNEYDLNGKMFTGDYYEGYKAEDYANEVREQIFDNYKKHFEFNRISDILTDIKVALDDLKSTYEDMKKLSDNMEFTTACSSKDDKSIKLSYTVKFTNYKPVKEAKLNRVEKYECTIENNLITRVYQYTEEKGTYKNNDKDIYGEETLESTATIEFKQPGHDNINLDDYILIKSE